MADKRVSIVFDASLEVGKMKTAIESINKSLQQTSVNIPKHTTQALTKLISSIQGDMTKLEGMTGANPSPKNSKEILKIQDTLVKNFKNLKTLMGNMGQDFKVDPSTFFPDNTTDKIEKATKALREYQQALAKGPQSEGFNKISEELKQVQKQQREYEAKARTQSDNKAIAVAAKAELEQQKALQEQIRATADEEKRQAEERIKQAQAQQRTEKQLEKIRSDKAKAEKRRSDAQATADEKAAVMATKTRTDTKIYGELSASRQKAEAKVAAESALIAQYDAEVAAAEQAADKIAAAEQEKIAATQKSAAAQKESSALSKKINAQADKIGEASGKFTQFNKQAEEAAKSVAELTKKQEEMQAGFESSSLQGLIAELKKLDITPAEQSLDGIKKAISKLSKDAIKDIGKALEDAGISAEDLESQLGGIGRKSREFAELTEAEQRAKQEMDSFKRSVMDFFSITNSVYLFKRAIQSAFETVKELDAVMTETAVVTDFTVGDMWEKLPEYADQASALGASIKDLYGATTLYYQQGLNSEQAMSIGIETMKMARIANMEAADATQAMTAALRGFNMEINETNATRINDVYSELAAITAADTNQIATAMTKTASIASSANMEFETTAALLAQIIETTQEAPETAGTAMKTIIARFTEVKKLFDEGMLSGEDSEGEAIEINKIDAALRTVGISLTDFLKGKKGIDDIFLELASKWDTLDLATQRYIATTAAGSRQQSRFIAMMSNYDRTMELVNAANNSAGASQEQFEKTLDSMQAKLQKLTNAWNEFTMGLANNEILKGGIDMLTWLLETINKLTDALSGGSGLSKSFLNLTTVVGALAGGKGLLEKVMAWAGGAMGIEQRQASPREQTRWQRSREYAADQTMGGFRGRVAGIFGRRQYDTKTNILDTQANRDEIIKRLNQENIELAYRQPANEEDSNRINNMMQQRQDIINQLEGEGKVTEELSQKYQNLGGSIEGLETSTQAILDSSKALEVDLQAVGAAALVAGGALGLLASLGEQQGWSEELINGLQTASAVLTGFGSALSILPMFLGNISLGANAAGLSLLKMGADGAVAGTIASIGWGPFLLIIGAVVVTVIALVAAFKAIHAASPEGKLEAATEAANDAAEAAENAAQAYEHLASALDSIGGKSAALENLAVGTSEWKNAVQELNGEVLDLVEQYPELAQFIDSGDGYLKLDMESSRVIDGEEKTVKDILSDYQENKFKAQSASAAAKLQEQQAKIDLDYSKLDNNIKITPKIDIPEYDPLYYSTQISQLQGGPYSQERTQKINAIQKEWAEAEKAYNEAKVKEANALFSPETRGLTDKVAKAIASNQIEGSSIDEKTKNKTIIVDGESYTFDDNSYDKLEEYGEGLVTADAATKVFTDSLLSNALMTAEVSEEQKSNMMNFFNSDQVESMLETEKTNLKEMDEANWEKQKEVYAKAMGYTYSDGNIYKGEAIAANKLDLSKDSLIEQIAGMNVTDSISGTMDKLAPKLSQMDASQAKLVSAFSSQNLDNLTIGEIDSLISTDSDKEMTISKVAEKLGYKAKDGKTAAQLYAEDLGYQDLGAFQQDINSFKTEADKQKKQITKNFDDLTGQENWVSENLADASYSTLNGLKEQASQMAPDAAKEYLNSFAETVKNEDLSEQDQKALQSYLSNMDWSDMSQAINAMDYMQQMGLDSSVIKEFWKVATDGANTYMSSMSQVLALTEKFQGKIKRVDEIEEALADGKATNEQIQQLIDAGIDVSNFELTADGWKATKEQIEEATRKLREYNAEQARAAADRQAEEIREMKSQARSSGFFFDEEGNLGASERVIKNSKGAIQKTDSGEIISGTVTKENMAWVSNLLDLSKNDEETDDDFVARLQAALNDFISGLNNAEAIQDMANKAAALAEAAVYTTDENVQRGGSAESVRMSMQQEAKDLGLDSEEIIQYSDALTQVNAELNQMQRDQLAIDYARMVQSMEEVVSKWDEWQEKISKDNIMEAEVAYNQMAEAANKLLGTTDALGAEFFKVKENADLLKKAAEGDADAFNKLQKAAGKKLVKNLKEFAKEGKNTNKITDKLQESIDNFEDSEINIGDIVKLDDLETGAVAESLMEMYALAYAAAREGGAEVAEAQEYAAGLIEAAGYEPPEYEIQETEVPGSAPDGQIANVTTQSVPGLGTVGSVTWETTEGPETSHTMTQIVPKGSGGPVKKTNTSNAKSKGKGGGGGGGGGKWKNSVDKLYNVQENIDRTTREREQIERRYQRLIDRRLATAQELQRVSQSEIESLREQAKYQQQMVEGRQQMLQDEMEENAELKKYATVNVETGQITIDWELINSVTDEEEGSAIEDYLSKLEELRDSMHEAQDALEDINDAVWEIEERGREEYLEFEERIKEALTEVRQKEIDTLEEINESINDTNDKLLDSIQQSIDKMRQDRENERTEEDLQEKQRRLAYLEQDTSNANAMEILELRKEIEEGQEDYTDTLIDQKISELQEQNDKAAEQREKQITLLQNQLDWEIESGRIWQVVEALMQDGLDPQGGLVRGSMLEKILREGEQWTGLSDIGQMNWLLDLETMIAESMNWRMTKGQLENLHEKKTDQEIEFINSKGEKLTGTVDEKGQVWTGKDTYYKDVYQWIDGTYHTTEEKAAKTKTNPKPKKENKVAVGGGPDNQASVKSVDPFQDHLNDVAAFREETNWNEVQQRVKEKEEEKKNKSTIEKIAEEAPEKVDYSVGDGSPAAVVGNFIGQWISNLLKPYKTGGLADFTGPAWLDGTKSRPELVLNQRDTQNFIQLKDVLSSIMSRNFSNTSTATENNGDITYDIDINVETVGSDYDVEQVANKVKSMINEDARYRNNNAISLKR